MKVEGSGGHSSAAAACFRCNEREGGQGRPATGAGVHSREGLSLLLG